MRRLICAVALTAVGLVTGAAAIDAGSASFVARLTDTACTTVGGSHGYGYTKATAHIEENGPTGTNYFKFTAWTQHWHDHKWVNGTPSTLISATFPDDATSHSLDVHVHTDFLHSDAPYRHRIKVKFQWWHAVSGPDTVLMTAIKVGPHC